MPQPVRFQEIHAADIVLPPPFRLIRLREVGDAFAHAKTIAATEGAGSLVFVGRFDLAEFALVLEPEEPLQAARRSFYACMSALGDALAAHAPPEKPIRFTWPDAVSIDGGLVGGGRLGWPDHAPEDAVPDWLVFGATIRMVSMADGLTGLQPMSPALADEGFSDLEAAQLVESFARHLMVAFDTWEEQGFAAIGTDYLKRLERERDLEARLEANGDLLLRASKTARVETRSLAAALNSVSWLDPKTGALRA